MSNITTAIAAIFVAILATFGCVQNASSCPTGQMCMTHQQFISAMNYSYTQGQICNMDWAIQYQSYNATKDDYGKFCSGFVYNESEVTQ